MLTSPFLSEGYAWGLIFDFVISLIKLASHSFRCFISPRNGPDLCQSFTLPI